MKSTLIFITLNLLFINSLFSQTENDKDKSIAVIENLMYHEFYLGTKCYDKIEITYYKLENRIEIIDTNYINENSNFKTITSFYINDLDLNSMVYNLYENKPGLYFVTIQIKAKEKTIEVNKTELNKEKFPYPVSELHYLEKLTISPTSKQLPENLAIKLIENVKILIGANGYKKEKL